MNDVGEQNQHKTVIGADAELGNFILKTTAEDNTCRAASRALLAEVDGVLADRTADAFRREDWGRKFLSTNGGSVYIDSDHFEICTPETVAPRDFVAAWHAMLRVAKNALEAGNRKRPDAERLVLLANNSDGRGNSYGSHLNFSVPRPLFSDLFFAQSTALEILAAYQVSSIIFTGQGKVGSENGRADVAYQLSQRADFFECLVSLETTKDRPLCNTRDEPLGTDAEHSRLHCIFYDSTLCHVATYLKVGVMNLVLALLAEGTLPDSLALQDPVAAVRDFSHDPTLAAGARLRSGEVVTALELQQAFLECARSSLNNGSLRVPGADAVLSLWADTLERLEKHDFDTLSRRLDWVLKRDLIQGALASRNLSWDSPEAKYLDHLYSSLDADTGLYWLAERDDRVERMVSDDEIDRLVTGPPSDTRASTRAMVLRLFETSDIEAVDWDLVRVRSADRPDGPCVTIRMEDPATATCFLLHTDHRERHVVPFT